MRILVVEENSDLRAYLWRTLSDRYAVQACRTGREAWVIIPEFKPDLVITDAAVAGISGEELCTAVKSHIETSHIPVVLLTALDNEKDILAGLQMGADEYIVKPFSVRILKAAVANLLKNRALLKEASLWNPDGNFDRISAMGMLMLLREDRLIVMGGDPSAGKEDQSSSYLGNDDFFTRNYDMRMKRKY